MGSGFCSVDEAARTLKCSSRSIRNFISRGLLTKKVEGKKVFVSEEDVELLRVERAENLPTLNRRTFLDTQTRLQKLEDEMRAVKHALELREVIPMRPDINACIGMLQAVDMYLRTEDRDKVWTADFIQSWTGILETMDEEAFSRILSVAQDKKAWVPFFELCLQMAEFCRQKDRQRPSLAWQAQAAALETVRERLRRVVVVLVELGRGSMPPEALEGLGDRKGVILSRLAKDAHPSG
jgi:hypothetical protein